MIQSGLNIWKKRTKLSSGERAMLREQFESNTLGIV